jgi:hypothetical protein
MNERLHLFLKGNVFDTHGRWFNDIIEWEDAQLEYVHDYIQWVFPLTTPSAFNVNAPTLDKETIEAVRESTTCILNITNMYARMFNFYQLGNYDIMDKWWVTPENHNFLRITRNLKSLKLFGMEDDVEHLFASLTDTYTHGDNSSIIGPSYFYWKEAAED